MDLERKIMERLLPGFLLDRINVEKLGIERFLAGAASSIPAGALVLDAGAGESPYRQWFGHCRYVAVDFARGEAAWNYGGLDLIVRLEQLPFRDDCFDAVLCTQVLEHLPEPAGVLAELRRVLKPGGILYLTAPQAFGEHQEPYDFFRFTSFGLRHLAAKAGLEVLKVEARGGFFWFLSVMLMFLYDRLFPDTRALWLKIMLSPLQCVAAVCFMLVIPLSFFCLDRLDTRRDITLGYAMTAVKPNGDGVRSSRADSTSLSG